MKTKGKIILGILLIFFLIIFYMGYTLYRNITDIPKLNLTDCSEEKQNEFLGTEECLFYSLTKCSPATNYNGFNILGWRDDKCKVLIRDQNDEMFFCYFSNSFLNDLGKTKSENIEDELVNFMINLKSNEECEQVGYSSMFLRRYWS